MAWTAAVFFGAATLLRVAVIPLLADKWIAPDGSGSRRNADRVELAAANVFSFGWIAFLATVVLLMIVWYRVLAQAKECGAQLPFGPGWAVGSWVVPFASFILTVVVAVNVIQIVEWRGHPPIGDQWRQRQFPRYVLVPPIAVVLSVVATGREGAIERDAFAVDVAAQTAGAVGTGLWVLALVATAVVVRRTRRGLAESPLVTSS